MAYGDGPSGVRSGSPTNSSAGKAPPEYEFDSDPVGSAGSLIAATLGTAGHSMQSAVLDFFQEGFSSSFGALIYIIAAIAAVFTVAVGGNYKFGLWFVVGPWLAYALLFPRVDSAGMRWKFGQRNYDQLLVVSASEGVVPRSSSNQQPGEPRDGALRVNAKVGEVSWFFVVWDDFVSDFVQTFVGLLKLDISKADLSFINKTEQYATLMSLNVQDPKLIAYLSLIMQSACGKYFGMMKDLYSPNVRINLSDEIRKKFIDEHIIHGEAGKATVDPSSEGLKEALRGGMLWEFEYYKDGVIKVKGDDPKGVDGSVVVVPSKGLKGKPIQDDAYGRNYVSTHPYSCEEVWLMGQQALRTHADVLMKAVVGAGIPDGLTEDQERAFVKSATVKLWDRVKNACIKHYTMLCAAMPPKEREECEKQAETGGPKIKPGDDRTGGRDDKGMFYMNCLDESQQQLAFINEIATRMFLKHLAKTNPRTYITKQEFNLPKPWYAQNDQAAHDLRESMAGFEYEGKGIYLSSILALPYIQGVALYFLSLAYPFVCLVLIFPGKHHAFMQWMAIWFWVKAWDIGFAIVMLMDELLYNLLPHGPPLIPSVMADPAEALKTVLEVDPTYSVNTYFNILGTLIAAVPVVTGLLIKHGGGGMVDALRQGFRNFSGRIGFAMLQYQTASRNMDLTEGVMKRERQAFSNAKASALQDPEVVVPLLVEAGGKALAERYSTMNNADKISTMRSIEREVLSGTASTKRLRQLWSKKVEANIGYAVYNESQSLENLRVAHDTIINWYSNHDFVITHPYQKEIDHARIRASYMAGGPQGPVNNVLKKVFKELSSWGIGKVRS